MKNELKKTQINQEQRKNSYAKEKEVLLRDLNNK